MHAVPALEGNITATGAAIAWVAAIIGREGREAELDALAASVPDAGGAYLVPAFTGLGAPHWDAGARGLVCGLSRGTTAAHLARAAFDAVAYQVRDVLEQLAPAVGSPLLALYADGGAMESELLAQTTADVVGLPVLRNRVESLAAVGAAYLAGLAVGHVGLPRRDPRPGAHVRPGRSASGRRRGDRGLRRMAGRSAPGRQRGGRLMARIDELRLMTRVARMYHESGVKQPEIAARLRLSQPKVSRLLRQAQEEGIVRITVRAPGGTHPDLELALIARYGLQDAEVVDVSADDTERITRELGEAAAYHVEQTVRSGDVIGVSSWSATLLALVDAMHPVHGLSDVRLVQILGGGGDPAAEGHATHLVRRLADLLGAEATFLPAPSSVSSAEARRVLLDEPFVRRATALFDQLTVALVGIGGLEPSGLLASLGNVFSPDELSQVRDSGGVGDIGLRYLRGDGRPVETRARRAGHRHRAARSSSACPAPSAWPAARRRCWPSAPRCWAAGSTASSPTAPRPSDCSSPAAPPSPTRIPRELARDEPTDLTERTLGIVAGVAFVVVAVLFGFTVVSTEQDAASDVGFDPVTYVDGVWDEHHHRPSPTTRCRWRTCSTGSSPMARARRARRT